MKIQIFILSPPLFFPPAPWIPPFRRKGIIKPSDSGYLLPWWNHLPAEGIPSCSLVKLWICSCLFAIPTTEVTESTAVFCSTAETYFQQGSILVIVKFAERGRYLYCGEEEEDSLKSSCWAFGASFWLPGGQRSRKPPPVVATWLSWKSGWGGFWDEIWKRMDPFWSRAG